MVDEYREMVAIAFSSRLISSTHCLASAPSVDSRVRISLVGVSLS